MQLNSGSGWDYHYPGQPASATVYLENETTWYAWGSRQALVEMAKGDKARIWCVEIGLYGSRYNWFTGHEVPQGSKGDQGDPGLAATWSSVVTYSAGNFVTHGNKFYVSLQDANLNKNPSTETTWWSETEMTGAIWTNSVPAESAMAPYTLYIEYY